MCEAQTCGKVITYGYGIRHLQAVLLFLCFIAGYMARGHLGVTIVAMTSNYSNTINVTDEVHFDEAAETNRNAPQFTKNVSWNSNKVYDWPKSTQEMVLNAFFVGYAVMMIPIGMVCQKWGGKLPLQICLLVNGIVSIPTPWLVVLGDWKVLCGCRVVQGLAQAGLTPGVMTMLGQWVPLSERGRFTGCIYIGQTLGNVLGFQIAGVLAASSWGWPSTFVTSGLVCIFVSVLLTVFGAPSPAEHRHVKLREKQFILGALEKENVRGGGRGRGATPWRALLRCRAVWAAALAHGGSGLAFNFYFTQVPSYVHHVLHVDVKNSGLLSSLPYVANCALCLVCGAASDCCTNRRLLTVANARRLFNTLGQLGVAGSLVAVSYTSSTAAAVGCFVVAMGTYAAVNTGWTVNYMDLSPNFGGTLMALGNNVVNVMSLLMPLLTAAVLTDLTDPMQWRVVLMFVAGFLLTCNLVFVLFMTSDTQPWNEYGYVDTENSGKEEKILLKKENCTLPNTQQCEETDVNSSRLEIKTTEQTGLTTV